MGLFSKKTYVCEKCGKEFQKRINLNGNFCDDCYNAELNAKYELKQQIGGYDDYASDIFGKRYNSDELQKILAHRNNLLEKFKFEDGISRTELMAASDNYRKLSDEQAFDVLVRVFKSMVSQTSGSVYSDSFFVPTAFDGMIVDAEDVFAVGMSTDKRSEVQNGEVIICACFTNDPYVPVFPVVYVGKKGFFDFKKSKKGRESVAADFEAMCPNLKYPVMDIKDLKKTIKQDNAVNGNIEVEAMLKYISSASSGNSIFNTEKMYSSLSTTSAEMLDNIGYIQEDQVNMILKMDKMLNRNYWNKMMDKALKK